MSASNISVDSLGERQEFYLCYNTTDKEAAVPLPMKPAMR